MMYFSAPAVFWGMLAIQAAGIASVVAARLNQHNRSRACCQSLFLACLCVVGLATVLAIGLRSDAWVSTGATFSIMAVGATCDFRSAGAASAASTF